MLRLAPAKTVADHIKELGSEWWQDDLVCRTLSHEYSRHLVALHLVVKADGKYQQQMYSGLAFHHGGRAFWLTAGHIVDNIVAAVHHPDLRTIEAKWFDNWVGGTGQGIPAAGLKDLSCWSGTSIGQDIGYISLRNADLMLRGNPRFRYVEEAMSGENPEFLTEGYHVVGFPTEFYSARIKRVGRRRVSGSLDASVAVVPFERTARRDPLADEEAAFWVGENSIFGNVLSITNDQGAPLCDMDG